MRILASTTAGSGHFLPLVPVLRACADAGHDVLVACPDSFVPEVESAGFAVAAFDDAPRDEWGAVMSRLPGLGPDEANTIVIREVFGRIDTRAALPRLAGTVRDWQPHILLRDPTEYASWVVAERMGLPQARVGITLLSNDPLWAGPALEGLAAVTDVGDVRLDPDVLNGGDVFAAAPATFDPPPEGSFARVHRYSEQPPAAVGRPPAVPSGDAPLVYVTLGTVAASLGAWPAVYRAIVDGLEGLDVRVLVTTGGDVDPADLGPLPDAVTVARFVPHEQLLPHCAVMITHGGFGTVLGGLRAGVPMVVVPLFADQPYNGARLAAVGAGAVAATSFDPAEPASDLPGTIRAGVLTALEEDGMRAAARRLSAEMIAQPSVGALVGVLERIAGARW